MSRSAPGAPEGAICPHLRRHEFARFDGVPLYECDACALVFREPTEADLDPGSLYDDFYKNELAGRFPPPVETVVRLLRLYRALKIFTIAPRARTILDIGSGRGFTLHYLRRFFRYRRAAGIQVSRPALEFSRKVLGLEIHDRDLLEEPWAGDRFDVVTMWHVLEHVIDPERYLAKIRGVLGPDSCFVVEVPNLDSWTRRMTGKYWLGLDLKYHLTFFSPKSLRAMLERHGFRATLVHTFSMEYSTFLSAQSIVSRITNTDQLFFRWLQGAKVPAFKGILHGAFTAVVAPFCLAVNLLLFLTRRGEVLCVVAKKNDRTQAAEG
jgi:SAM-dependent methyltransferase